MTESSEMPEEEFWDTFKPLPGPTGDSGEDIWEFAEIKDQPLERVWTIVEDGGETENWYAIPGFHIVNKIGYALTEKPWTDESMVALWFDASDLPAQEDS